MTDVVEERRLDRKKAAPTPGMTEPLLVADPASRHEPFPLTDVQKAYWLGRSKSFELGNVGCHFYLEIEAANVDRTALQAAWRMMVRHHDMLSAVIRQDGMQQILEHTPDYLIEHLDLRGVGGAAFECFPDLVHGIVADRCRDFDGNHQACRQREVDG
jgi:hypothetical protein